MDTHEHTWNRLDRTVVFKEVFVGINALFTYGEIYPLDVHWLTNN